MTLTHSFDPTGSPALAPAPVPVRSSPPGWTRSVPSTRRAETWVKLTLLLVVGALLYYLAAIPEPRPDRIAIEKAHAIADLRWTLVELRAVIADYHADHGAYPGRAPDGDANPDWFARQLMLSTNRAGDTATKAVPSHPLGPYEPAGVPRNPINGLTSVRFIAASEPWPTTADGKTGWVYRPSTGEIRANSAGIAYGIGQRYWDL